MCNFHRYDAHRRAGHPPALDPEGPGLRMERQPGDIGVLPVARECVPEHLLQHIRRVRMRMTRHRRRNMKTERPQIIQPYNMVEMVMRPQYRINVRDAMLQHLLPKVRSCVNHNTQAVMLDVAGCPQPPVPLVC